MKTQVTIIGVGTMGRAIWKSIERNDKSIKVFGVDKVLSVTEKAKKEINNSQFVILAVKPQDREEAIQQFKVYFKKEVVLISIMAGVSLEKLRRLSGHKKIIRMMPNLGLSVGHGIAAWKSLGLSVVEKNKAKNFLNKITDNFEVKNEDTINKVTAISGSGPAYFFLLADSLIKVCQNLGFTKEESRKLVEKTLSASAELGKEEVTHADLIKRVASKGGTTEAALKVFKQRNFEKIIKDAVTAAYKRAKELNG